MDIHNNGSYIGFTYNGVEYYYVYNLQGDVEAITDAEGTIVAKYEYDEWGYVEYELNYNGAVNISEINPIRYRGYYYDSERGLYYLNSRYYDPFMCRFLNADGYVTTGQGVTSFNMFTYCLNNPVNMYDPNGCFGISIGIGKIIAAAVAFVVVAVLVYVAIEAITQNPPSLPTIALPTIPWPSTEEKDDTDVKEKDITIPPSNGTTYYHVTTQDNAEAIMTTGIMTGSKWESGYVYAWKTNPSKYAIENSGAHMGVTISFKTSASFVMDTGVTDPKVQMYGPVVSTVPGPIVVWDVQIVG